MQKLLYKIAKITSIALLTLSINNNVYAGGVTFDPTNFGVNLVTSITSGASAVSNGISAIKDTNEMTTWIADKVIFHIVKNQVANFTKAAGKWIEGGFNGEPAFLTNPAGFARSVLATQLDTEVNNLVNVIYNNTTGGIGLITDVIKQTANENQENTIGLMVNKELMRYEAIYKSICDQSNQALIKKYDGDKKYTEVLLYCGVGGVKNLSDKERANMEKLYVSLRAPIDKYGYYDAVMKGNTRVNVSMGIASQIDNNLKAAQDRYRDELLQNGGFLGERRCVKKDEKGEKCIEYKVVTPGSALSDAASFLQLQPNRTLEQVETWNELTAWSGTYLTNSFVKLGQNTVTKAVSSTTGAITSALDKFKEDAKRDIVRDLNNLQNDLKFRDENALCTITDESDGSEYAAECPKGKIPDPVTRKPIPDTNPKSDRPAGGEKEVPLRSLTAIENSNMNPRRFEAIRKVRLSGPTTTQEYRIGSSTIIIEITDELFNSIREYKRSWVPVFATKFNNSLYRYKDLYYIYQNVMNNIIPKPYTFILQYKATTSTTTKSIDWATVDKAMYISKNSDFINKATEQYRWKSEDFIKPTIGKEEDRQCDEEQRRNVSKINSFSALYYCFDVADSMEMVDSLMNKIDEFDNKIGVTNNKKASLKLEDASTTIAADFSIPTEIIYQKEKNDYTEWSAYYEAWKDSQSESQELAKKKVRQENDRTYPNIKNKAFYVNLNDFEYDYYKARCRNGGGYNYRRWNYKDGGCIAEFGCNDWTDIFKCKTYTSSAPVDQYYYTIDQLNEFLKSNTKQTDN